MKLHCTVKAAY